MKYALIQGTRICQIANETFPVHSSLEWVEVPDDTTTRDTFENGEVVKYVAPTREVASPSLEEKVNALLAKELDGDSTKLDALRTKLEAKAL